MALRVHLRFLDREEISNREAGGTKDKVAAVLATTEHNIRFMAMVCQGELVRSTSSLEFPVL